MNQDWEIKKLDEICEFSNGLWTGKKPPFQKVGVIRNTNFTKDGKLNDKDIVYLDVEQSQFSKRKLQFGDIILERSGKYLVAAGRTTVALESTGSYWQPLFVMLQQYNLAPILVNGKFTKNVKGRKTDVKDCQWIQKLHTMGMLEGSFIPDLFTEKVRQYYRHRQTLVDSAASYINKMQKALRLINIRLDSVLRDVMGRSGKDIIEAILKGERDAKALSLLAQPSVKKTKEEIASALTGDWRQEYIFELKQCYEIYKYYHKMIDECDEAIKQLLTAEIARKQKEENLTRVENVEIKKKKVRKNEASINLQQLAVNLTGGVDISSVEGGWPGTCFMHHCRNRIGFESLSNE